MNTKLTFKQSQQHGIFYAFLILLMLLVAVSGKVVYVLVGTPLFIYFFRDYHITEMHTLVGNGTVAIATIEKLVVNGNKVTLHYRPIASTKLYSKNYYLRTPKAFVDALVEINPAIVVYEQK